MTRAMRATPNGRFTCSTVGLLKRSAFPHDFVAQRGEVVSAWSNAHVCFAPNHTRHSAGRVCLDHGTVRRGKINSSPCAWNARQHLVGRVLVSGTTRPQAQ